MVPETLKKSTLRMHHEGYGHMGANRMLETIRLRYFWSNMDKDISDHTGQCLNCKLRKTYQRKPKVPLMKYDDTARPLDRVHIDLTGPLPMTRGKHRYIMVIKDYLTKYVWLIPLKTKTAQEVAEAVEALLGASEVLVERMTKSGKRVFDARSAILLMESVSDSAVTAPAHTQMPPACVILHVVVRHIVPSVRPDDVLTALKQVGTLEPRKPVRVTRLAQGPLSEVSISIEDPFDPDRVLV
jgi:hypothetical protein